MSKRLFCILALLCAALPVANALSAGQPKARTAVSHPFVTGIAEQLPDVFTDSRFLKLKITHVRVFLPWDVLLDGGQADSADKYLDAAHADKEDVLIAFTQSRRPGKHSVSPTSAQLVTQLKAMRKRWPWVKEFSTWNEANLNKKPATVAGWWMALTKACPTCTILGADLVDRSPVDSPKSGTPAVVKADISQWVAGFLKATKGKSPKAWGLHDYVDANLHRTVGTAAMLKATKNAQLWLTETGGLVSRTNGSTIKLPEGQTHATNATKFILTTLARVSPRIKRVYLYQWTYSPAPNGGTASWDSAFTGPKNQTRSSLTYLTTFLTGKRR
jgi:hypothetical protein